MDDIAELRDRIAQLESTNAQLARDVAELRDLVVRQQAGGFRSIRDSRRCPACGGSAFLHAPLATQASHMGVIGLGLAHEVTWSRVVARGELESFTCRACGLVELHVIAPAHVAADGKQLVAIDAEPAPPRDGPFR